MKLGFMLIVIFMALSACNPDPAPGQRTVTNEPTAPSKKTLMVGTKWLSSVDIDPSSSSSSLASLLKTDGIFKGLYGLAGIWMFDYSPPNQGLATVRWIRVEEDLTFNTNGTYESLWAIALRGPISDWETVVAMERGTWRLTGRSSTTLRRTVTSVRLENRPTRQDEGVLKFLRDNSERVFVVDQVTRDEMIMWTGALKGQGARIRYVKSASQF